MTPDCDYVRRMLAILDDREPVAVHRILVPRLRELIEGLDAEQLAREERPGKWSIAAIVRHLADNEIVYGYRMRMILAADSPNLNDYDENAWAATYRYMEAELAPALAELETLRAMNLRLLETVTGDQWERIGVHSKRGPETLRRLSQLVAAHDIAHIAQVERVRRAVEVLVDG